MLPQIMMLLLPYFSVGSMWCSLSETPGDFQTYLRPPDLYQLILVSHLTKNPFSNHLCPNFGTFLQIQVIDIYDLGQAKVFGLD